MTCLSLHEHSSEDVDGIRKYIWWSRHIIICAGYCKVPPRTPFRTKGHNFLEPESASDCQSILGLAVVWRKPTHLKPWPLSGQTAFKTGYCRGTKTQSLLPNSKQLWGISYFRVLRGISWDLSWVQLRPPFSSAQSYFLFFPHRYWTQEHS